MYDKVARFTEFRIVFIDFDGTIRPHIDPGVEAKDMPFDGRYDMNEPLVHRFYNTLMLGKYTYHKSRLVPCTIRMIEHCRELGIQLVLLTTDFSSTIFEAKVQWLEEIQQIKFDDYIMVSDRKHKKDMIIAYASYRGLDLKQVCLVDDNRETCRECILAGIPAYDISDIATLFDNSNTVA